MNSTIGDMLTIFRRHVPKCPHLAKGRDHTKCRCPIHCDGMLDGRRHRASLKTRDWARAVRKVVALEAGDAKPSKPIKDAAKSFLDSLQDLAHSTQRNNKRVMELLQDVTGNAGISALEAVKPETIDAYRAYRATQDIELTTWQKELQVLRHFFGFCVARKWIEDNPAKAVRMPKNARPRPVEPYTVEDCIRILAVCDTLGRCAYERLRARAMVLLLRYTALRIGDVATLAKDRIVGDSIRLQTMKTGATVLLPLHPELRAALDLLPEPRGGGDGRYFFWSGKGSARAMVRDATRTLARVFKISTVPNAHAHRFRHTLCVEILLNGGTVEDAANILGNSPAIIRKHYAPFTIQRQDRIKSLLQTIFSGTLPAQRTEESATC